MRFVSGLDLTAGHHVDAADLPATAWKPLKRPPEHQPQGQPRTRPERVQQQIVADGQFKDIRLVDEEVAEMPYPPVACQTTYRLVIVRKLAMNEPKQARLFAYRYFLYLTNDWDSTMPELVFSANDRCQQENVIAQLAAVRAWHAPVDNLLSNEAYMLITAVAWTLRLGLRFRYRRNRR